MTSTFFAAPGLLVPMQGLLRWLTSGTLPARRAAPAEALPPLLPSSASMQASPSASQECQRAVGIKIIANYSSRTWGKGINSDSRSVSRSWRAPSAGKGAAASRSAAVLPALTVLPVLTRLPVLSVRSVLSVLPASPKIRTVGTVGTMRAVRVRRLVEAGQAPTSVGRMVISGRMADVCAELDRLAAREAALH